MGVKDTHLVSDGEMDPDRLPNTVGEELRDSAAEPDMLADVDMDIVFDSAALIELFDVKVREGVMVAEDVPGAVSETLAVCETSTLLDATIVLENERIPEVVPNLLAEPTMVVDAG